MEVWEQAVDAAKTNLKDKAAEEGDAWEGPPQRVQRAFASVPSVGNGNLINQGRPALSRSARSVA